MLLVIEILAGLLGLWMIWNLIELAYHLVALIVCTVAYTFLTLYEWTTLVFYFAFVLPICCLFRCFWGTRAP